jgi:short-subunit dehydrogenase
MATATTQTPRADDSRLVTRYGPWAVVTGASDGIGRGIARQLAAAGLHLVLVARRAEPLERLAEELRGACGVEVLSVPADLSRPEGPAAVEESTAGLPVGLLVAAAGFGTSGSFVDGDVDEELELIDVNCRAVAALAHHFGGRFARQGRGGLILMSSLVAFQGVPRSANYAASKAYVQSLAEALRVELAPRGVDVVASAPGPVASGFAQRSNMRFGKTTTPEAVARGTLNALGRRTTVRPGWLSKLLAWALAPLPRWGRVRMMGLVMGGMTSRQADGRSATGAAARGAPGSRPGE